MPELNIVSDELMSKHTTFKVGGAADYFASPTAKELGTLLAIAKECDVAVTIIGNGSNLLVGDRGIRGLVIEIGKAMEYIQIDGMTMTVGAGTILAKAANEAACAGLGGMEFAGKDGIEFEQYSRDENQKNIYEPNEFEIAEA